eukprot:gnl/TRDRNA2_/TRDRNA2_43524_c0_seq1.p2 gnl/TRDRNA2_/TRDRNA2_43524_c0~~gnl/TRDRNA2_/TRDRNA2_43524_c0_seq1.p2  ORF type:complete len:709 (-),score=141.28 gnl/TRDRNA2_/TRDRNA2_43524_c0_seq1:113-2131(-)
MGGGAPLPDDPRHHTKDDALEDPNEWEAEAGHVPHHCTDILCLLIFIASLGGLGFVIKYAVDNGDLRRVVHGYDFQGRLCGVTEGNATAGIEGVENKSLLYWCPAADGLGLDLAHPICTAYCPNKKSVDDGETRSCFDATKSANTETFQPVDSSLGVPDSWNGPPDEYKPDMVLTMKYIFDERPVYKTTAYGGMYCFPEDTAKLQALMASLNENPAMNFISKAKSLENAVWPLIIGCVIAFVFGFVYLFVMRILAKVLVCLCLFTLIVGSIGIGAYLICTYWTGGVDGIAFTGDSTWDLVIGIVAAVFGVLMAILVCFGHEAIEMAVGCVEAACECIFDMPTLLLEPLITISFKAIVMVVLFFFFIYLVSVGKVETKSLAEAGAPSALNVGGVYREFTYDDMEMYYILYYVFMAFWIVEIATALAQFTIAYSVQLWYFTPYDEGTGHKVDVPYCPIFRGYRIGLMYHLGSLAFGAFIVAVLRLVRMILGFIAKQAKAQDNQAAAAMANCLMCCVTCFQRFVEFLNKNAYMDIAINSTTFCTGAYRAMQIIIGEVMGIAVLNGACWIFVLAGVGAITTASTYVVWIMINEVPAFDEISSPQYIEQKEFVAIVSGILSALVAVAFMIVFDTVADTVLYCYATEKRRQKHTGERMPRYAPTTLQMLIDSHAGYGQ